MFKNYLTEIISKKAWHKKAKDVVYSDEDIDEEFDEGEGQHLYRKKVVKTMDFKEYKESLKVLKAIFKKLNHGVFKSTLIFDWNKIVAKQPELDQADHDFIEILKELGYTVSEESYMLGFVQKNNKSIMINDVMSSLDNKNIESMQAAYEKSKNENIKKQIDVLERYNDKVKPNKEDMLGYQIAKESKLKLVISIQPRLIASQSTQVGWRSCMNLDNGEYNRYVGSGISHGVIIVYVTRTGDEHALNSPMARVLLKPLRNENGDIAYAHDQVYGTAPAGFIQKVRALLDMTGKYVFGTETKPGVYTLDDDKTYLDNDLADVLDDNGIVVLSKTGKELIEKIKDTAYEERKDLLKGKSELGKEIFAADDATKAHLFTDESLFNYSDITMDFLKSFKNIPNSFYKKLGQQNDQKLFDKFTEYLIEHKKISLDNLMTAIHYYKLNDDYTNGRNIKKLIDSGYNLSKEEVIKIIKNIDLDSDNSTMAELKFITKEFYKKLKGDDKALLEILEDAYSQDMAGFLIKLIPKEKLFSLFETSLTESSNQKDYHEDIVNALSVIQIKKILNDIYKHENDSIFSTLKYNNNFEARVLDLYHDKKIRLTEAQKDTLKEVVHIDL